MDQTEYLEILFNDCGFSPSQWRDFLGLRYGGRRHFDELSTSEKHQLIGEMKERRPTPPPCDDDEDSDPDADMTAKERIKKRLDR